MRDNIGFALLRDRHPRAEVEAKVREIAGLLEIEDILDRYPPTISAGQQQRTSLARALIRNADSFLLDEPMSQLEPQLRAILRARIKDWLISRRMTTVFVTHDQTEAIALADRIAVMEKGVLQQLATPAELKERPANLFVASFIGEPPMNIFRARASANGRGAIVALDERGDAAFEVALPDGARDLADGRQLWLGVRPHRIRLGDGPGALSGVVASNHWLGDQSHLGVEVGRQPSDRGRARRGRRADRQRDHGDAAGRVAAPVRRRHRARPVPWARRVGPDPERRMTRELIIGIDSGTSVIKAVAFDLAGRQLDLAALPNRYERARRRRRRAGHGAHLAGHRRRDRACSARRSRGSPRAPRRSPSRARATAPG